MRSFFLSLLRFAHRIVTVFDPLYKNVFFQQIMNNEKRFDYLCKSRALRTHYYNMRKMSNLKLIFNHK